jgi:hypothetical protein
LANQAARVIGRLKTGYRFGQTRFEAKIYNDINFPSAIQIERQRVAVTASLDEYWQGLIQTIAERASGDSGFIDTLRVAQQRLTPSPIAEKVKKSVRLYSHTFFLEKSDSPFGNAFASAAVGQILGGGVPREVSVALCDINLFTWFVEDLGNTLRQYINEGKHPWQFWSDHRVTILPPNFYALCRGWE